MARAPGEDLAVSMNTRDEDGPDPCPPELVAMWWFWMGVAATVASQGDRGAWMLWGMVICMAVIAAAIYHEDVLDRWFPADEPLTIILRGDPASPPAGDERSPK